MIDAVGISDQRVGEAGKIDEAMPIGVIARKPRHLETEHKTNAGECNLGGEARKSGTRDGARAGKAEILIDDENAILGPAEFAGLSGERILALRRFAIVLDLRRARLTKIDDRLTREMHCRDLGALIHCPPPSPERPTACGR